MAFKDLDEALGELGYAGAWQDQTEAAAVRATENSVKRWRDKGKFVAHFPEIKARAKARRRASHLRLYVPRPRVAASGRRTGAVPTCHPDRLHKAHGLCWKCYRMKKNSGAGLQYWHLPTQTHRHCYAWEIVEQRAATQLARQRAEAWA